MLDYLITFHNVPVSYVVLRIGQFLLAFSKMRLLVKLKSCNLNSGTEHNLSLLVNQLGQKHFQKPHLGQELRTSKSNFCFGNAEPTSWKLVEEKLATVQNFTAEAITSALTVKNCSQMMNLCNYKSSCRP